MRRLLASLAAGSLLVLAPAAAAEAASYDPVYRFRTLSTPHFVVYFHQGEDALAARLAELAEDVWRSTPPALGTPRPRLTHVVLVDQTDLANGLATPVPYDTIVLSATWPAGSEFIGKTADWLRMVFTHEFTHVVHLDQSGGWAKVLRGVFGRHPLVFPNLFLPQWQIEGLATYEESAAADAGRLHAGDFRTIVGEGARAHQLEPLDRLSGGLTTWPGGLAAYAYGAGFHEYLASRFGEATFASLAAATAGRVPFTGSWSFRKVYGQTLGSLWSDYLTSVAAEGGSAGTGTARRITHHGFIVRGPRFIGRMCDSCPDAVAYSAQTPHGFPSLNQIDLNGGAPRQLAERYQGSTSGVDARTIYFDQQEVRRNTGVYSDLYALDRETRAVRRLTNGARLMDPDLSPDRRAIVCVQDAPGRRDLVLVSLPAVTIAPIASAPETQFNAPRWSPDGRAVVVERHMPGRQAEIVVVDVSSRTVQTIASSSGARFVTPTWRPDGRAVVVATDLDEGPFQLYEIELDPTTLFDASRPELPRLRQLTGVSGGATWPDVSADGKTLVYVGYGVDGFDLFSMPYPTADAAAIRTQSQLRTPPTTPTGAVTSAPYSPLTTLRPTSWSPILEGDRSELRFGFEIGGVDVLGYHGYAVSATWLTSTPDGAVRPSAARPDWRAFYQYARWQPTMWLSASSQTSFFAGPADPRGVPTAATLQERQVEAGVLLPVRRVRIAHTALFSIVRSVDDLQLVDRIETTRRVAARAGWSFTSAHTYGYSISPEEGATVGVTVDLARRALGSSADSSTATADGRAYLPMFGKHHVLAIRLAGGISTGDAEASRTFLVGGAQPNLSTIDFGHSGMSLLRGFSSDSFAGSRVALLNADYRWPLAWPERGHGTWPLFLRSVSAAIFADVGHAWTHTFDVRDVKTSVGGELSADGVAGYSMPFTATVGAAYGRDGSRTLPSGGTVYVRLGRAF